MSVCEVQVVAAHPSLREMSLRSPKNAWQGMAAKRDTATSTKRSKRESIPQDVYAEMDRIVVGHSE